MLIFKVDGKEIDLDASTNFEFVKENPFITKNGGYTYNIDISLRSKTNANIFRGIRDFKNKNLEYNFSGQLWDNNKLICKGKVIVLSKEDRTIHLQIVSDNSELNYIFNKTKIRNLDLGSANDRMVDILENNNLCYPDVNYSYPMIRGYYDDYKSVDNFNVYGNITLGNFAYSTVRPNIVAQPYLIFVIRQIFDALGYAITSMFIEKQEKYKRLLMINPYKTNQLEKMLPDWTATDFITEIEHFFNGMFIINDDGEVSFEKVSKWYEDNQEEIIIEENTIDEFNIEFVEEGKYDVVGYDYKKVAYEGIDNQFWKAAKVSNQLLNNCTIIEDNIDLNNFKSFEIYSDSRTGLLTKPYAETKMVKDNDGNEVEEVVEGSKHLVQINQFRSYVKDEDEEELSLKIFPCQISKWNRGVFVPVVPIKNIAQQNENFWDAMKEWKEDEKIDYMNVAFYLGKQFGMSGWDRVDPNLATAPQCSVSYYQFFGDVETPFVKYAPNIIDGYNEDMTLELDGEHGRARKELDNFISWDKKHLYTVRFITNKILDPKKIFVIKGDRFICKQLKYNVYNCKMNKVCEGEFYRMI